VSLAALSTIAGFTQSDDEAVQQILDLQGSTLLPLLCNLLEPQCGKKAVVAIECAANIAAGPERHVQALIDYGIVAKVGAVVE
jgi:hypothetical protein